MSWTSTLRKKGSRSMSTRAIGLIEYVLTSEPQSVNEILEAMFEKGDEYANSKMTTSHQHRIPTRNELTFWLSRQPHIKSARFHKWTNKITRDKSTPNTHMKYWRP